MHPDSLPPGPSHAALLNRVLRQRPRAVPIQRLVGLLALEARPRNLLLVGSDSRARTTVEAAFPTSAIHVSSGSSGTEAGAFDTVLCLQGLTYGFESDASLVRGLLDLLVPGGHLATLELAAMNELRDVFGSAPLTRALSSRLVPLHLTEEPGRMGRWRHVLFVGRKGNVIR